MCERAMFQWISTFNIEKTIYHFGDVDSNIIFIIWNDLYKESNTVTEIDADNYSRILVFLKKHNIKINFNSTDIKSSDKQNIITSLIYLSRTFDYKDENLYRIEQFDQNTKESLNTVLVEFEAQYVRSGPVLMRTLQRDRLLNEVHELEEVLKSSSHARPKIGERMSKLLIQIRNTENIIQNLENETETYDARCAQLDNSIQEFSRTRDILKDDTYISTREDYITLRNIFEEYKSCWSILTENTKSIKTYKQKISEKEAEVKDAKDRIQTAIEISSHYATDGDVIIKDYESDSIPKLWEIVKLYEMEMSDPDASEGVDYLQRLKDGNIALGRKINELEDELLMLTENKSNEENHLKVLKDGNEKIMRQIENLNAKNEETIKLSTLLHLISYKPEKMSRLDTIKSHAYGIEKQQK